MNIIVVDDERMFRSGLVALLNQHNINTIAVASNGQEALMVLKKVRPHILLLDLEMPVLNGSCTLDNIMHRFPGIKVIILSAYHDIELIKDLLNRGAKAFVSKKEDFKTLAIAIHSVYSYGFYDENLPNLFKNPAKKGMHYFRLIFTKSEVQIINLICSGKTTKLIASELFVSEKTIEGHLTAIYKKVQVKNKHEFLKYAIESGLQFLGKPFQFKSNPLSSR